MVLLMLAQRAVDVLDPLKQLASHPRGYELESRSCDKVLLSGRSELSGRFVLSCG